VKSLHQFGHILLTLTTLTQFGHILLTLQRCWCAQRSDYERAAAREQAMLDVVNIDKDERRERIQLGIILTVPQTNVPSDLALMIRQFPQQH
jgi:hypothetical protein